MYDFSKEVLGYHDDQVTLPQSERDEMRDRRNANRDRLKAGLKKAEKPKPLEFKSQGSYAMKTMTQHPEKDYDIDDGVYFDAKDLVGPKGGETTALGARQLVRDTLDDGSFNTKPEVRNNCVRIYYDAGCHVDMPVYRRVVTTDLFGKEQVHHELASTYWKRSDARDVTAWFEDENNCQSPTSENGRQLRRLTRLNKKFARSRSSWKDLALSGFGVTKLVTECYRSHAREDTALYETMKAIRDRLNVNLIVKHPVTPGDTITEGSDDPKATFLRDKLSDALKWLEPVNAADCTRETAMKCWDKVFSTTYFTDQIGKSEIQESNSVNSMGPTILKSGLLKEKGDTPEVRAAVRKEGGGRYA